MMSNQQIQRLSDEAARRSRAEGILPITFTPEELGDTERLRAHVRRIPFIGTRRPRGYRLVNASKYIGTHGTVPFGNRHESRHYIEVDASGFGAPGEIALTFDEFLDAVRKIGPYKSYAIIEQGQFQVVIGVFERGAAQENPND
jgi:hypothetical protein